MMAAAVRAAAMTPIVLLEWSASAPYAIGANPKAAGMLEYAGSWPGAYLLRRGLFLPNELPEVMDAELAREGLRRLGLMDRLAATIDPDRYLDDIKFLASKEMKGRGTGTPELEKAAAYIAADFRSFGLQPIDGKSYYQAFSVTTHARLGKDNRFAYTVAGKRVKLSYPEDFTPFNFSARARLASRSQLQAI